MPAPTVYLLYGDDEFAISRQVASMQARLGDPATAELNTSFLDGRTVSLSELEATAGAAPFLATRRLIVLSDPLEGLTHKSQRERFTRLLARLPPKTALVIRVSKLLPSDHWLLRWAGEAGPRAFVRSYRLPRKGEMARWIQQQATERGGAFTPQAARALALALGTDTRQAAQEIEKLLAFVNYSRPVEVDDVAHVAAPLEVLDDKGVFRMVDALGNQDGKSALDELHRLLLQKDPLSLFGMIVRQFRLLLLAREVIQGGGGVNQVRQHLGVHPYVAQKVTAQARNFDQPTLEAIYHHLLDLDTQIKSSQVEAEIALDTLVAALTPQSTPARR